MHTEYGSGNLRGRDLLEGLGINGTWENRVGMCGMDSCGSV
jgi:hypothetical protein